MAIDDAVVSNLVNQLCNMSVVNIGTAAAQQVISSKDRLSDLPKDIIDKIMERLPLRDAAKMSTLSKEWSKHWLTLPYLVLDRKFFIDVLGTNRHSPSEYNRIVSKILLQHSGHIFKFSLHISHRMEEEPDFSQWISFLSNNGISEFCLYNWKQYSAATMPRCFFGYSNWTKLKLDFCTLKLPCSFEGFPNLISISLCNVNFSNDEEFEGFVTKCPRLEKWGLMYITNTDEPPHFVINASKLKYLTVGGRFKNISIVGSPSLLWVSTTLTKWVPHSSNDKTQELVTFLASLCRVEKLCFGIWFLKLLIKDGASRMLPMAFTHVKILRLDCHFSCDELPCAFDVIQSCPNVEELHIFAKIGDDDTVEWNKSCSDKSDRFPQLRKITFRLHAGLLVDISLIEFLLDSSPVLDTIELDAKGCDCRLIMKQVGTLVLRKLIYLQMYPKIKFSISRSKDYYEYSSTNGIMMSIGSLSSNSDVHLSNSDGYSSDTDSSLDFDQVYPASSSDDDDND